MDDISNNLNTAINPIGTGPNNLGQSQPLLPTETSPSNVDVALQQLEQEKAQRKPFQIFPSTPHFSSEEENEVNKKASQMGIDPSLLFNKLLDVKKLAVEQAPSMSQASPAPQGPDAAQFDVTQAPDIRAQVQKAFSSGNSSDMDKSLAQFKQVQSSNSKIAESQAKQSTEMADAFKQYAEHLKTHSDNIENLRKDYNKNFDKTMNEYDSSLGKMRNFEFKDYWADKNAGQKITAGLSIALGAAGQSIVGGPNVGMELINNEINRDLQLQKLQYDKNKDQALATQNKFAMFNSKFDNEKMAEMAAKDGMLAQVQNKLAQITAQNQSPQLLEKAKSMNAQIEQQRLQAKMGFEQMAHQMSLLNSIGEKGSNQLTPAQEVALQRVNPEAYKIVKEHQLRTVHSKYYPEFEGQTAASPEQAKEFREYAGKAETAKDLLGRAVELSKNGSKLSPTDRAKMDTLITSSMGPVREFMGMKTLTEGDQRVIEQLLGNPMNFMNLTGSTRLRTVLKNVENDFRSHANQAGIQPKSQVQIDKKPMK